MKDPICPDCECKDIITNQERGECTCSSCGLVIEDNLVDFGKEWFDGGPEGKAKSRTGAPLTMTKYDQGLTTMMGNKKDMAGINPKNFFKMKRLKKWHNRFVYGVEANMKVAFEELNRLISHLKLPKNVEEEAARIYREAIFKDKIRGNKIEVVIAACCYIASRKFDNPRLLNEVAEIANSDKRNIGRTSRMISRALNLNVKPTDPTHYIGRFINELNLSAKVQTRAMEIYEKSNETNCFSGKNPVSIAAAAVYLASVECKEKRTQREIANVSMITEVTVRNRYKELIEFTTLKRVCTKCQRGVRLQT
tara:strand:- start:3013 stop:3936 length:924 start_codon:yes stop_codon:yes gene_type:complete